MKVILYMATSLNGIIAGKDGSEDFLSHANWVTFIELAKETGNFIYGRKTYDAVMTWGEAFIHDLGEIPTKIAISSEKAGKIENGFEFVGSAKEALSLLEKQGYTKVLVSGGATNNSTFAKEGLLDEVIFNIEPAILGEGVPVFQPADFSLTLTMEEVKKLNEDLLQVRYTVVK